MNFAGSKTRVAQLDFAPSSKTKRWEGVLLGGILSEEVGVWLSPN